MLQKFVTIPTSLPKLVIKELDVFVRQGFYTSRTEIIREAVRRFVIEEIEKLHPSHLYLAMLQRELAGKIKSNRTEEIVRQARRIRKQVSNA